MWRTGCRLGRDLIDRPGHGLRQQPCIAEVRLDGGDRHARLDRDQVDTDQRNADPRIDDDTLVEDPVEYVNDTASYGPSLDGHDA